MKKLFKYFFVLFIVLSATNHTNAQISVGVSIRTAPPALPIYTQRYCPGDGYMWTPGYWAYNEEDYYWVPDTWLLPPQFGFLWTPGYWGFADGFYGWNQGYWGRHIGYYGGINYGCGYAGSGYGGGMWQGNVFRYNTAVNNINTTIIHNTYVNNTVINNNTIVNNNRTSFNGQGGITTKPTQREQLALKESHLKPTTSQLSNESSARVNKNQFVSVNHGHPEKFAEVSTTNNLTANLMNNDIKKPVGLNQQQTQKVDYVNRIMPKNIQNQNKILSVNQNAIENQQKNANNQRRQFQSHQMDMRNQQENINHQKSQQHFNQQQKRNQQMNGQHEQQMQPWGNRENSGSRGNGNDRRKTKEK